jgi:hypothetical protein
MTTKTQKSAEQAFRAITVYRQQTDPVGGSAPDYEVVTDLLTDLWHFADEYSIDLMQCMETSARLYREETSDFSPDSDSDPQPKGPDQ